MLKQTCQEVSKQDGGCKLNLLISFHLFEQSEPDLFSVGLNKVPDESFTIRPGRQ